MMQLTGLIILVALGGYFFYTVQKSKKSENKKNDSSNKKVKETVQDLFEYKQITDKGVCFLKDGAFTATMEVSEINQRLNNLSENTEVWRKFRGLVNSLSIRHTYLVQSQYLNLTDFVNNYDEQANNLDYLTPQFKEAKEEVVSSYRDFSEIKTKEVRAYVIFRFNPYKEGIEKGLDTGNAMLNNLINATKSKTTQMTEDEAEDLATAILDEVTDLAGQLFHGIGIRSTRLNRTGVLNMVYMTLNRDLTLVQRLSDAATAESFSEFKASATPFLIENYAEYEEMVQQGYEVEYVGDDNEPLFELTEEIELEPVY
ncbi:hypothetical protein WMO40_20645 [Bacillaceae bacterium CLA-AA-H227]|uniref:Uncharacterized protein n=1 Tax=Robertmurraya yapensis (ex Hitch et al 2024) TaxID=3133160 RepID=A0ACC6SGW6_9BACI